MAVTLSNISMQKFLPVTYMCNVFIFILGYLTLGEKVFVTDIFGSLLLKFFEYYSYYYDNNIKISINKNLEESMKNKGDKLVFSIEDPFEANHNPGKYMKNNRKYNKFIYTMKKEINNILSGEYIKKMSDYFSKQYLK